MIKQYGLGINSFSFMTFGFGDSTAVYNPVTLFAAGQQGVIYDPSDLTTLFQDAAGTVPVTKSGDPVALMLDKSRGLALGAELVVNGDFANGLSGWAVNAAGVWSVVNGVASHQLNSAYVELKQTFTGLTGLYEVSFVLSVTQGAAKFAYIDTAGVVSQLARGIGTHEVKLTAKAMTRVLFCRSAGITSEFTVDNVSIKEIKGNHATQSLSASRPTYQTDGILHWLTFDGVDDWLSARGFLWLTRDGAKHLASIGYKNNSVTVGYLAHSSGENFNAGTTRFAYITNIAGRDAIRSGSDDHGYPSSFNRKVLSTTYDLESLALNYNVNGVRSNGQVETVSNPTLSDIMTIGCRSPSSPSSFWSGNFYSFVINNQYDPNMLTTIEAYVAAKTGVTL